MSDKEKKLLAEKDEELAEEPAKRQLDQTVQDELGMEEMVQKAQTIGHANVVSA